MATFNVGDLVQLKSGSYTMTVSSNINENIQCIFWNTVTQKPELTLSINENCFRKVPK